MRRWLEDGLTTPDRQRIIRGVLHSFVIQGFSVLLVFVSNLWIVKSSDAVSYGLYIHIFNWVSILSVIVMGGRDDLLLAQLPRYIADRQHSLLIKLVRSANRWIFTAALVVGGLFMTLLFLVPVKTLSEHRDLFLIAMIAVYFTAFLSLNQLILQALNHIRLSQIVEKLGRPLLLIVLVVLFRQAAMPFTGKTLVILSCISLGICCAVIFWLVARKIRHYSFTLAGPLPAEKLSGKTFYFFSISLLYLLSTRITMLILPYFMPQKDIGIFNISYRFADLVMFPFFLMHTVLPQLFARHAVTETGYTRSLFNESNRLMILLSLPLLLLNLVGGKFFLHLFGGDFEIGYHALIIISLSQFLFAFFGPTNTILMMQNREKYSALCLLAYVIVLLVSSRLLIPLAGITGGALAILISSAFYNLLLAVITYRLTGICPVVFSFLVRKPG
jgi:O-antigen/teichoic acid export membrane protein